MSPMTDRVSPGQSVAVSESSFSRLAERTTIQPSLLNLTAEARPMPICKSGEFRMAKAAWENRTKSKRIHLMKRL